ncbi:MAG: glycosyltransferase family 4 protein [Pseudomonadota bacterium]
MDEVKFSVKGLKTELNENSHLPGMHIMMMIVSYPPIIDSGARLYSELSESLREMGHNVTVISEHPANNSPVDNNHEYFTSRSSRTVSKGEVVLRVSSLSFMSKIIGGKPLRFLLSCFLFAIRGIFTKRPDVILVYSPPLYMGISGYLISKVRKARFVFNLQDIHPKVLFDSGAIKNPLIKRILSKMEEVCYRKAHSLIAYSGGNRDYIIQRGANGQVYIIPNWADTNAVVSYDKAHSFRKEEIIGNKFVVSYAGTMQQAQGLEVVVETAEVLKEYKDIIFLLAGEGTSKPVLEGLINEKKINNVLLRPVMPKERYKQFLYESDVCLITLSLDIPLQTVPGKLADIMGYGKPLILVANPQGDAAKVINKAKCGFCVNPGDAKAFSRAVLNLYRDEGLRKEMGENARLFAEQHFSRAVCTKQYEKVLFSAMIDNNYYV